MKPYPKYKYSGVEWLGEVPEHWDVSKLRYVFSFGKGLTITKANLQDKGIPCVNYGEIHSKYGFEVDGSKHDLKYVDESYLISDRSSFLSMGDFIFADTSEDLEGAGNFTHVSSQTKLFAGYHTVIARQVGEQSFRYLAYLIDSETFRTQIRLAVKGVKVFSITQAILRASLVWLPKVSEQQFIANFLDRETTHIDSLIKEKENFISLLKEKRQALISHTVTKGLNPTVKMKDSGIEWLGDVPEHWGVKKVKHIFEIRKRISGELGYPVLSITQQGIKVKDIISGKGQLSMDYSKYQFVEVGDFAMNHMDLLTGYVDLSKFHGVTSPDYRVFSLIDNESIDSYYLYLMQMGYKNKIFFSLGQGVANVGRWRLQTKSFNEFNIPYPNKNEQKQIAIFLDKQTTKIDSLVKETKTSIELLKEHRTALISAAVTGKIDVRDFEKEVA